MNLNIVMALTGHVRLEDHGTIWLVAPVSEDATEWLRDNVSEESEWMGNAVVVEPRYVEALVVGMFCDLFGYEPEELTDER